MASRRGAGGSGAEQCVADGEDRAIHKQARGAYGARRVHAELRLGHGIRVGRKRVQRPMRQAGISGLITRRRGQRLFASLVSGSRMISSSDSSCAPLRTCCGRWHHLPGDLDNWLYLARVQDTFSRGIVGLSMTEHMRAELVVDALSMAVSRRRPEPGLVLYSDRGSSTALSHLVSKHETPGSPSRWILAALLR